MVQALFDKGSDQVESHEISPGIVSEMESTYVGPIDGTRNKGWSERRLLFLSEVHNSDRKIATALYIVLVIVLVSIVGG